MTIRESIRSAAGRISARDAELVLAHCLKRGRVWVLSHVDDEMSGEAFEEFTTLVARRAAGEPLQYILGSQEFFGLSFRVAPGVLIPRPETEHLVEAVLTWLGDAESKARIVDVGTGSGAIAIALAKSLPAAEIIAVDISIDATGIASENARALGVEHRVSFHVDDLLASTDIHNFDAVVSNPPYVSTKDAVGMQKEVVDYEPHLALFAGDDGLEIYRRLIPQAQRALRNGGLLAMEFGYGQQSTLHDLLAGWDNVRFIDDYAGIPRVVLAERR